MTRQTFQVWKTILIFPWELYADINVHGKSEKLQFSFLFLRFSCTWRLKTLTRNRYKIPPPLRRSESDWNSQTRVSMLFNQRGFINWKKTNECKLKVPRWLEAISCSMIVGGCHSRTKCVRESNSLNWVKIKRDITEEKERSSLLLSE